MKKVLHVIAGMNAGGMETMIMNFYRNLDRDKYQFDFLINDPNEVFFEKEIIDLGGHVYRAVPQRKNFFKKHKQVDDIIKQGNYDAIHCHQGITYYYPLKSAKKHGIKNRIVHNHGINRKFLKYLKVYNELYAKKRICGLANNYIACSKTVMNHIYTNKLISSNKVILLPNAIDVKKYLYNSVKRIAIRKELGIKKERVFIHVGTFTTPKNHFFLIDVFEKYLSIDPTSKLILVGEGILKEEIISTVNKKGISDNVIFTGVRKDIPDMLSAADMLLFPSLYEGLPLTLIEAQANGIKIISSENVSQETRITDLIEYLPIDNIDSWVDKINQATFEYDRKKYNSELLKSDFSVKVTVKKLQKIYDNIGGKQ